MSDTDKDFEETVKRLLKTPAKPQAKDEKPEGSEEKVQKGEKSRPVPRGRN
ncbi:MAG: hypothetical protein K8R18_09740 [Parvibaculum sp.]|uniref:hypothetical protein n=1 Tax=Parvibaculum sp. TaxID=2024848 RepID=UPI0025DAC698|nr:hypothetical protein [Parvibaculum sp.]MCE9649890.1 hypothetical protein [Parvibaculum sp.]